MGTEIHNIHRQPWEQGAKTKGEKEKEEIKGKSQNQKKQDKKLKRLEENKRYKITLRTNPETNQMQNKK